MKLNQFDLNYNSEFYEIGLDMFHIPKNMVFKSRYAYLSPDGSLFASPIEKTGPLIVIVDVFLTRFHKEEEVVIKLASRIWDY